MIRHFVMALIALLFANFPTAQAFAATPVSTCGAILSVPGDYKVTADLLVCPGSFAFFGAITIVSSDVHLHMKGHQITCDDVDGVPNVGITVVPGLSGVHIEHGSITGCDVGILMIATSQSKTDKMTLSGNLPDPVFGGGHGLFMDAGNDNTISNSQFSGNRLGIGMTDSSGNRVTNNEVTDNFASGMDLDTFFGASNGNQIVHNIFNGNGNGGISIVGNASGNIVRGNTTNENGLIGIGLVSIFGVPGLPIPEGNVIKGNTALANGEADLVEAFLDFSVGFPPDFIVSEPCRNDWQSNNFVSQIGPDMCIGDP